MTLFDRYVVVDWSAAASPKRGADSIWLGSAGRTGDVELINPPTRRRAERELTSLVARLPDGPGERLLIAIDVALGFPRGTAAWFGLPGDHPPWRAMWRHVAAELLDDHRNRNDRFRVAADLNARGRGPGPFWGCPTAAAGPHLRPTKPSVAVLPELRCCEDALRSHGRRPFSVWQLLGAGSVGGQTLTALPVLERLLGGGRVDVWPFTTGLVEPTVGPGGVVVAEVWPSGFDLDVPVGVVKDAHQVAAVVGRLRDADRADALGPWFGPEVPAARHGSVVVEEGWLLHPPDGLAH